MQKQTHLTLKTLVAVACVAVLALVVSHAGEDPSEGPLQFEELLALSADEGIAPLSLDSCNFTSPISVWEADARDCARVLQGPAWWEPVLYWVFRSGGINSLYLHFTSSADVPILFDEDDYAWFTRTDAQDGFFYPQPRKTLTPGYWKNWENHFVEDFMALFVFGVNENSLLFGEEGCFGKVDLDNVSDLLSTKGKTTPLEKLRVQLLATWLTIEASFLPLTTQIEPASVPGASAFFGNDPRALHVDPVGAIIARGGVVGTIEDLVASEELSDADIEVLKNVLDAINNGDPSVVKGGTVVEPGLMWEAHLAQTQYLSHYTRLRRFVYPSSLSPRYRQPPGLAASWACTEGLSLHQGVALRRDFTLGGEIMPDPIVDLVSPLRFGMSAYLVLEPTDIGIPDEPRSGIDQVLITIGDRVHDISVEYDPDDDPETQFHQFLNAVTRGTGLEAFTLKFVANYATYFGTPRFSTRVHAVLTADTHWKLENIQIANQGSLDPRAWFVVPDPDRTLPVFPDEALASYGKAVQSLVTLHLEVNPVVVIGKTPLYGTLPQTVSIRATNIGRVDSSAITITDTVPPGLAASNFSVPPTSITGSIPTGQTITWDLPFLEGSKRFGVRYGTVTLLYDLSGTVTGRVEAPGATVDWNGETSRSTEIILVP